MDEKKEKLADQIWDTRVSRAKAEQRLINKENFIQFVNIYYSVVTIICSILSHIYGDKKMGLFTIISSISLMIAILYLNGQKYLQQARDYRSNYTKLQHLEMIAKNSDSKIEDIQNEYCKLLDSASNHIWYDYLCAIRDSSEEYRKKKNWSANKKYWLWGLIWRFILKIIIVIAPLAILILCEVFAE